MSFLDTFSAALPHGIRLEDLKILVPSQWWHDKPEQAAVSALCRCGKFDTQDYLKRYPDVAQKGLDPVLHFVQHGIGEKRHFKCLPDTNLGQSKVRLAYEYFQKGEHEKALRLYKEFSEQMGAQNFAANMAICKKKLGSKNSLKSLAKEIYKPKVSVIIAAFNASKFLDETISNLLNQTLKDIEIILVDDGSTDCTLEKMAFLASKDRRITYFSKKNEFAGVARNYGYKYASGEYIIFLDSDDIFEVNMLELAYLKAKSLNLDIVIFDVQQFSDKEKTIKEAKFALNKKFIPYKNVFSYYDLPKTIYQFSSSIAWNKLIKKSLIDINNISFGNTKSSNDIPFTYTALVCAEKISYLDKVLITYRYRNNSLQRSKDNSWNSVFFAYEGLQNKLINIGKYSSVQQSFVNKAIQTVFYYMDTVNQNTAIKIAGLLKNKYAELLHLDNESSYYYSPSNYKKLQNIISYNYIPIVYSIDINYFNIAYISIKSMVNNIDINTYLIIYILYHDIPNEKLKIFDELKNDHVVIEFINMETLYRGINTNMAHVTTPAFFRLEIPRIFYYYDKMVYLDCDTIINSNIKMLFNIDIDNYYVAGVHAPAFNNKFHEQRLKIKTDKYINSGVLLINIKKINIDNIYKRFKTLLHGDYSCADQDIINVACADNILLINKKYNFMTKYVTKPYKYQKKDQPYIIHYADKIKPWNDRNSALASFFWEVAQYTPFYTSLQS